MIKNLFFPLIVGLLLWLAQSYLKDVPTATYSVSEAIEIVGLRGKTEYAQEISVSNTGRSVVKSISIKVPYRVSSYKLTKHSSLIKEEVMSGEKNYELVYPELPTKQNIRLLIRYEGSPINKTWISVGHADGNAESQDKQGAPINFFWIWLGYMLGYVTFLILDIREYKKRSFKRWWRGQEIYRDDKPWFASSDEWSEMQYEAIQLEIEAYSYNELEQSPAYLLFKRSKPKMLSDEQWGKLQSQAAEIIKTKFSREVNQYSKTEKLVDLLKLKKPEALSIELWSDIQKSLVSQLKINLLPTQMNTNGYEKILDQRNTLLNSIPDTVAKEIRELAQQYYCDDLTSREKLEVWSSPSAVLKTARFDLLTEERAALVKKKIIQFMRVKEFPSNWSVSKLELFISKGKPEWMQEDEFKSICDYVSNAKIQSGEHEKLRNKIAEVESKEHEVESVKKRVLAQLDLINKVLTDPTTIERIEDYDNTFAAGNRRNIELIASILRRAATDKTA